MKKIIEIIFREEEGTEKLASSDAQRKRGINKNIGYRITGWRGGCMKEEERRNRHAGWRSAARHRKKTALKAQRKYIKSMSTAAAAARKTSASLRASAARRCAKTRAGLLIGSSRQLLQNWVSWQSAG